MKKTILAPAVALAFTGLIASPVAAAEAPAAQSTQSEQSDSKTADEKKAEAAAEKAEKEKAEKEAAAKAKKEAAAEKKAAEEAAKKKAAEDSAKKKAADEKKKSEGEADGSEADSKSKDNEKSDDKDSNEKSKDDASKGDDASDEGKDEVQPIRAKVQVTSGEVTAEELAEEGVTVKVTGLEKGDKVSATSGLEAPSTKANGSTATVRLQYAGDPEGLDEGKVPFSISVQRQGTKSETLKDAVSLVDEEAAAPKVSISEPEISENGFEKNGVEFSGTGYEPNSTIEVSAGPVQSVFHYEKVQTNEDGEFTTTVTSNNPLTPGEYEVRAKGPEAAAQTTLTITADSIDASLKVDPDEITAEDLANKDKGVIVTVTGVQKGDKITDSLTGDTKTAEADGHYKLHLYYKGDPKNLKEGELGFTVTIDREGTESETLDGTINVVDEEDGVDPIDATLTVDPAETTAEDLANKDKGVIVTVSGVQKGDKITDSLTGDTKTAEADGDYKLHLYYEGSPKNLEEGELGFTVTIDREGTESETLDGTINVVADETEAPAEASFTVSPKTIEAADFANDKKGVTLAVENCEPGADVHFEVNPKGINVTAYENTVTADDEGRASVNVYGTSSNASAYVGSYTATATCGDDTMKDSFKVTEGANAGGDNGDDSDSGNAGDNGNDGSSLPRTGADLGGLTTGALLLLVGGAAIALTGRKNKAGQTPTSL